MDYSYEYTSNRCWYTTTMTEHMRQMTRGAALSADSCECDATLCTFFIFLLFLTSFHLFSIVEHYFALILQYCVARCLFQRFLQKHDFDHFDLILFKRLSCKILFSDFVYLLLDRIANTITQILK